MHRRPHIPVHAAPRTDPPSRVGDHDGGAEDDRQRSQQHRPEAHRASLDDGLLHVYSLEIAHWWDLLTLLPSFVGGRHGHRSDVRAFACTEVEIRTRRPKRVNTDGEVSTRTPARFRVLRNAVRVYTPAEGPPGNSERS